MNILTPPPNERKMYRYYPLELGGSNYHAGQCLDFLASLHQANTRNNGSLKIMNCLVLLTKTIKNCSLSSAVAKGLLRTIFCGKLF